MPAPAAWPRCSRRPSWRIGSGSTSSASASITAPSSLVSAPAVVLAAVAARTSRIRLTSAVSVLSSDDPVRVFQEFATLDLLSGGRAEIMAGRGSFIESFPLFGYDLEDYDVLFAEKLELLLELREQERISWTGPPPRADRRHRRLPAAGAASRCRCGSPSAGRRRRSSGRASLGLPLAAGDHRRRCPSGSRRWSTLYRDAAAPGRPRPSRRRRSASTRTPTSRTRASRPGDEFYPRLRGDDEPDRPRARLVGDDAATSSTRSARRAAR